MHGGLRKNRAIMLRLPRQAHYSICEKLCARDTARLSETASQWYRKDDPRHAAMRACIADRVARARVVTGYVGTIVSTLQFIEAVERRDWEITPTGRDGDCSGQLKKILRSYTTSFAGGLKDGDDIVFPPGEYRFVHIVKLYLYEEYYDKPDVQRIPQITLRGVGGPSKPLLYADADAEISCLFYILGNHQIYTGPKNLVIRFSGLAFSNDRRPGFGRNSIVRHRYHSYRKILRMNDCHVRTLRSCYWRQDAGGPYLFLVQRAKMEECSGRFLCRPTDWETSSSSSSSSSEDSLLWN